jgi:hypothetical protein
VDEDKDVTAPMADDFEAMLAEEEELASREIERLEAVINALHKVIDAIELNRARPSAPRNGRSGAVR